MDPAFELFQHTADMGLRVLAPTLPELVLPATQGLYAAMGELKSRDTSQEELPFLFSGADPAHLLRDYLAELLFHFESKSCLVSSVTVENFTEEELSGHLLLCPVDEENSVYYSEVKAITYHQLSVIEKQSEQKESYYEATLIMDI